MNPIRAVSPLENLRLCEVAVLTEAEKHGLLAFLSYYLEKKPGEKHGVTQSNFRDLAMIPWMSRFTRPPLSVSPINSDEFRDSIGQYIPRPMLHELAELAGLSPNEAFQLPLYDLLLMVQFSQDRQTTDTESPAHSEDFRSVRCGGTTYTFSPMQAAAVQVLWREWENGTPVVSQDYILAEIGSNSDRLRDIFRSQNKTHRAFDTLIKRSGKGNFYLDLPPTKKTNSPSQNPTYTPRYAPSLLVRFIVCW